VVDGVIDDLRERGWVAESSSGSLQLTPDGVREQQELAPLVEEVRHEVAGALPEEDYVTLVRLLARLVDALPERSG
jgi:DNA-binding MarR family transcriptional regulator